MYVGDSRGIVPKWLLKTSDAFPPSFRAFGLPCHGVSGLAEQKTRTMVYPPFRKHCAREDY